MTAQEIIEFLQRNRSILNRFGVKTIALFGSYLSGQYNVSKPVKEISKSIL